MDEMVKRRLVGASVLALLGALILPILFGQPQDPRQSIRASFEGDPVATGSPSRAEAPPVEALTTPGKLGAGPAATKAPVRSAQPPTAARTASTPAPAAAQARWILQLASYTDQRSADDFRARLRKQGHSAYRESVTVSGKEYFRVRMSLHMSEAEARQLQRRIEAEYKLQAQLLPAR